jgi:ABC-2 type transport system permease protein
MAALSLAHRELIRFLRQRHRIIGALATPLVFWLLIGAGMGRSFSAAGAAGDLPGGENYLHYFFPGTILMVILFTAIFSTISVIEDRREGFLQGVLVAPVSRGAIVLGKVLGGTVLAFGQGIIFLVLAPLLGIRLSAAGVALCAAAMFAAAFALTALGLCIAWRMNSTQGFHAIMNLFLMPMWFLSGALFPASGAWSGLRWVMAVNPLTYALAAIRRALYWPESAGVAGALPGLAVSLVVTIVFAMLMFVLAGAVASASTDADLE